MKPQQPANATRFKALAGAIFQRVGPEAIRVWRETPCSCCERPMAIGTFTMTCASDRDPMAWGLSRVGRDPPPEGYSLYAGSPLFCGLCAANWQKGISPVEVERVR